MDPGCLFMPWPASCQFHGKPTNQKWDNIFSQEILHTCSQTFLVPVESKKKKIVLKVRL